MLFLIFAIWQKRTFFIHTVKRHIKPETVFQIKKRLPETQIDPQRAKIDSNMPKTPYTNGVSKIDSNMRKIHQIWN